MTQGIELVKKLALCFGPTSCEGEVEKAIREELAGLPSPYRFHSSRLYGS